MILKCAAVGNAPRWDSTQVLVHAERAAFKDERVGCVRLGVAGPYFCCWTINLGREHRPQGVLLETAVVNNVLM